MNAQVKYDNRAIAGKIWPAWLASKPNLWKKTFSSSATSKPTRPTNPASLEVSEQCNPFVFNNGLVCFCKWYVHRVVISTGVQLCFVIRTELPHHVSPNSVGGYSISRRRKSAEHSSQLNVAKRYSGFDRYCFHCSPPLVGIRVQLIPRVRPPLQNSMKQSYSCNNCLWVEIEPFSGTARVPAAKNWECSFLVQSCPVFFLWAN